MAIGLLGAALAATSPAGATGAGLEAAPAAGEVAPLGVTPSGGTPNRALFAEVRPPKPTIVRNGSLELVNASGVPRCFVSKGVGESEYEVLTTDDAASGTSAAGVRVTSLTSGDRRLVTAQGQGRCVVRVQPGTAYDLSLSVQGDWEDGAAFLPVFVGDADGKWRLLEQLDGVTPTTEWTELTYRTSTLPEDVELLSFGLALAGEGEFLMDEVAIDEVGPYGTAPQVVWVFAGLAAVVALGWIALAVTERLRDRRRGT